MKKITLECFTSNAGIHELFPISPAKKFIPEWFKSIPSTLRQPNEFGVDIDVSTLKRCDGLTKLYNTGFVLPLWSDFIIETNKDGGYKWSSPENIDHATIDHHHPQQMGNQFSDYVHVKIVAPWILKEKTGVDWYWSGNTWGTSEYWDDINILPGLINYKNQPSAHINMFVKKDRRIELKHNTPLIQCVPLTDAKLEIKNTLATDQEYKHLKQVDHGFTFVGLYKKRLKLKNERK